jgi:Fe-S cluster biogenesis protein NfuA
MNVEQENTLAETVPPQERLQALIEQLSAYIEHYHRGWVELVGFDGKTVKVRLGGACETCGLKTNTLHGWVEGTIRQFFPEVERVEAVEVIREPRTPR